MEQPRARSSFVQRSRCRTCRVTRLFGRRSDLLPINGASSQSPDGKLIESSRGLVVLGASEQRPDDACVLGGDGDRGNIVRAPAPQAFCPAALGIAAVR